MSNEPGWAEWAERLRRLSDPPRLYETPPATTDAEWQEALAEAAERLNGPPWADAIERFVARLPAEFRREQLHDLKGFEDAEVLVHVEPGGPFEEVLGLVAEADRYGLSLDALPTREAAERIHAALGAELPLRLVSERPVHALAATALMDARDLSPREWVEVFTGDLPPYDLRPQEREDGSGTVVALSLRRDA